MAMADWHTAITALTEAIRLDPTNTEVVSSFAYVVWQVHHLNSASPTLAKHKWLY